MGLGRLAFIDPDCDAPAVHQYSVDMQRQLPGDMSVGLTYMGATGRSLTWGTTVNINQVDPRYLPLGSALTQNVTNPFFGNPAAGSFATRTTLPRHQLLRPFPQYGNITMSQSTLRKSQYHAGVIALTKRTTGWWGGRVSYTWSRLEDNQFGQGNYYSSAPGILNNYTAIPWSEYFNPDAEYGRSLDLDVINLFDNPWYAALASVAYSPTSGTFGRVTAQANYSRTLQFTARFSF